MSIKNFAINTSALTTAKLLSTASQLLILPIIARHLSPDDFGLVAIAMAFIFLPRIIIDAGLGQSLIRSKKYIELEWLTIFWFIVFLGLLMAGIMIVLSPMIARFFAFDELEPILNVLAFILLLQSLIVVPQAEMQRRGDIARIAIGEIVATFAGFAIAIWIAINGGGVWALVYQQVVFWTIRALNIILSTQLKIQFKFSYSYLKKHFSFGRDTVAFGLVMFLRVESVNILLGKVIGTHSLGLYSMSNRFSELPGKIIIQPLSYVFYAHLTKIADDISLLGRFIVSITRILAIIMFPAVAVLAAGGETFFTLFLSDKWSSIAIIFAIIAPVGTMNAITTISNPVLMSTGDTRLKLRIAIESTIFWIFILLIAVWYGLVSVAVAYVVWYFAYLPRFAKLFLPKIGISPHKYFSLFITPALISIVIVAIHISITRRIHTISAIPKATTGLILIFENKPT